jgi:hypothetical protein
MTLICIKIVVKSKELKTGSNLADASKEGYDQKGLFCQLC